MSWIKCSEKLPEKDQEVLFVGRVSSRERWVFSGVYDGTHFWCDDGWWQDERVTHWMPTPELPEEDKQ